MKVVVLGLGYVGTVTAAGLASRGHEVVGVDVDPFKVGCIAAGRSPVVEPGIDDLVADAVAQGNLRATHRLSDALPGADLSLICVGTPSNSHGGTDLRYVERVAADLRAAMTELEPPASGFHSVVVRSTVPPGTVAGLTEQHFDPPPAGWSVGTGMCPEFLREGCSVTDFFDPPMVVVGTTSERTHAQMSELFGFLEMPVYQVDIGTAEALKYASNAFHATKISFANEIARVFRNYKVDSREVMSVFSMDQKLNISPAYLRPGFAFGGSCLPKDLRSLHHLARANDVDVPLLLGTTLTNEMVLREAVDRVLAADARTVALFGLSFKMDTDDLRESPNVELVERLVGKGLEVRIFDPIIHPERLVGANRQQVRERLPHLARLLVPSPEEALPGADMAVVSANDEAVVAALLAAPPPRLLDLNGRLGPEVEQLPGYEGIGW
ncbi:MAG TPA: nucleotide sugar dehydrogenase [Nocardioides sp.]|jgi:GDP-mannose 6-dehydrogenase|nr:nucleotide sugar dehydrogenase [Nocardioides sp.]